MKVYTTDHIDYWYFMFCVKLFHAHNRWHRLPNWWLSLQVKSPIHILFYSQWHAKWPQLGALYLQFFLVTVAVSPIFIWFVTLSSVLCHCFKAMSLVVILLWKGVMSNEPVVVWGRVSTFLVYGLACPNLESHRIPSNSENKPLQI